MYCRIINGAAVDVVPSFKNRFHISLHKEFVECPDHIGHSWLYDEETDTWSEPVIITEPLEEPTPE